MVAESVILESGQETQASQAEGQHRRDDALEEPGSEEHRAIAAERQDQVEFLGLAPAQVRRPVLEHVLEAGVLVDKTLGVEALGVAQLCIHVNIDAKIGAVSRGVHQPLGEFACQDDKGVVSGLGDDHDIANGALDRSALQLLRNLADTSGGLDQTGM